MSSKIPREFVPCDVNLANDPAILHAGFKAELLFRRANEYAKRMNRDGIIYPVELPIIAHGIPGDPMRLVDVERSMIRSMVCQVPRTTLPTLTPVWQCRCTYLETMTSTSLSMREPFPFPSARLPTPARIPTPSSS